MGALKRNGLCCRVRPNNAFNCGNRPHSIVVGRFRVSTASV
jgi:hypothetical protein